MHARAKIILLVVAPNHLVLEVFPCTTYVMWKRTGEVRVGQVTAEDRGRALHPRKSPQNSHGCGRQCRAGLLMQGLIHRDPLEDDRLVAKSYKLYFALEGERERLSGSLHISAGSFIFSCTSSAALDQAAPACPCLAYSCICGSSLFLSGCHCNLHIHRWSTLRLDLSTARGEYF